MIIAVTPDADIRLLRNGEAVEMSVEMAREILSNEFVRAQLRVAEREAHKLRESFWIDSPHAEEVPSA